MPRALRTPHPYSGAWSWDGYGLSRADGGPSNAAVNLAPHLQPPRRRQELGAARGRAARRRGGAAATDGGAHQPGAGRQEPRRGWSERVAAARRRERRVAASSWAPLSRGCCCGGGGFLCPDSSLARRAWCRGRDGQESAADPSSFAYSCVYVAGFRARRRLRSGRGCRQCPLGGHPPGDGRSGSCRRGCRVELRPICHRQRNGKIRGAETESKRGGAALPGTGSSISPLPPSSPSASFIPQSEEGSYSPKRAAETPLEPGALNSAEQRAELRAR